MDRLQVHEQRRERRIAENLNDALSERRVNSPPLFFWPDRSVDGTDLHRVLYTPGSLNPAQTLELISQNCDTLHCVHSQGVIHRNIKPGNILVTTGSRAKIADSASPARSYGATTVSKNGIKRIFFAG